MVKEHAHVSQCESDVGVRERRMSCVDFVLPDVKCQVKGFSKQMQTLAAANRNYFE